MHLVESHRQEEADKIRGKIYRVIDCSARDMDGEEYKLWDLFHTASELLSAYYEKKGYRIWKH